MVTLIPPSRRLGWLLSIYGIIGVLAAIAVLAGSMMLGYQVGRLRDSVASQRQALIATLDSTILLLGTVTSAAGNIDTALSGASSTLGQAAGLAQSAGDAAQKVADAAGFEILGNKPLAGVVDAFAGIATQAHQIAGRIGTVSDSLNNLSGDLTASVPALQTIQAQAVKAKADLQAADRLDDLPLYVGIGVVGVGLYLAWLGMTSLAAFWLGRRMLRMTRPGSPQGGDFAPQAAAAVAVPRTTPVAAVEGPPAAAEVPGPQPPLAPPSTPEGPGPDTTG